MGNKLIEFNWQRNSDRRNYSSKCNLCAIEVAWNRSTRQMISPVKMDDRESLMKGEFKNLLHNGEYCVGFFFKL